MGNEWVLVTGQVIPAQPRRGRSSTPRPDSRVIREVDLSVPVGSSSGMPVYDPPRNPAHIAAGGRWIPPPFPGSHGPETPMCPAALMPCVPAKAGQLALTNAAHAPKEAPQPRAARRTPQPPSRCTRMARAARRLTKCSCVGSLAVVLMALAVLLTAAPPGLALSLERAASTVADVTEATSVVAMSGANITMAISEVAVSAVRGASSTAAEAWHGVDLLNVVISARAARFFAHVSVDALEALETAGGGVARDLPAEFQTILEVAFRSVGPLTPQIQVINSTTVMSSKFHYLVYEASFFSQGYVGMRFLFADVNYEARWANPFWEVLYDVATEWPAIAAHLHEMIRLQTKCPWAWEPLAITEVVTSAETELTWWRRFMATIEVMRRR